MQEEYTAGRQEGGGPDPQGLGERIAAFLAKLQPLAVDEGAGRPSSALPAAGAVPSSSGSGGPVATGAPVPAERKPLHPAIAARLAARAAAAAGQQQQQQPAVVARPPAAAAAPGAVASIPPASVGRLAILSLGAAGWDSSGGSSSAEQFETDVYRTLLRIRRAVTGSRSCAIVTLPTRKCLSGVARSWQADALQLHFPAEMQA